jgi:hypothetical protein
MVGLPHFELIQIHDAALENGIALETEWMTAAADGCASAHLWEGVTGYVVPRSYESLNRFTAVREECNARGTPVQVRTSGGGLVPQGPGVLNVSLMWSLKASAQPDPDATYKSLSNALIQALAQMEIAAQAHAVSGSFCDGRYNLAIQGRKVVGTAQSWRRISGRPVVLAHAVVIVDADPMQLTEYANSFELALGTGRHYCEDALTSVVRAWAVAHEGMLAPQDLSGQYQKRLFNILSQRVAVA